MADVKSDPSGGWLDDVAEVSVEVGWGIEVGEVVVHVGNESGTALSASDVTVVETVVVGRKGHTSSHVIGEEEARGT